MGEVSAKLDALSGTVETIDGDITLVQESIGPSITASVEASEGRMRGEISKVETGAANALRPFVEWKKAHDDCEAEGKIKGVDGCRSLSSSCAELSISGDKNSIVEMMHGAKEYIPGTVVRLGCKVGYGVTNAAVVSSPLATCLSTGDWSVKNPKPECVACNDKMCGNCDGNIKQCNQCKPAENGETQYIIGSDGVCKEPVPERCADVPENKRKNG